MENCSNGVLKSDFFRVSLQASQVECAGVMVKFRPMAVDDYEAVRNLIPLATQCNETFSVDYVQLLLSLPMYHPVCAVRVDNNSVIGYAELYRLPHLGRKFDCRLERVVTSPDFRGKGLATKLCEYLIKAAKSQLFCGKIELTVEKPDARHIYEKKLGFSPVDTSVLRLRF